MTEVDLTDRFPDLKPIKSAPSMFSVNGFGLSTYGARDNDAETGTYVKTHCLTALFIPLFALGAYRVAKAPGACLLYTSPSPRDLSTSRMPSSA